MNTFDEMWERIHKKLNGESKGLKAKLKVSDAANTGYDEEFFDCAIDSAVIYANKVEDIKIILKEAKRVLKEGGKLFSTGLFNTNTCGIGTGIYIEENTYRKLIEGQYFFY